MPSRFSSSRILAASSTVALGMGKVPTLVAATPRRRQASLMTGRKGLRMEYRSISRSMICWPLAMPARSFSRKARTQAAQTSGTERDGYLKEAEDVLMENMVICPINYTTYTQVIDHSKVSGPGRTPVGQWDFQYFTMVG